MGFNIHEMCRNESRFKNGTWSPWNQTGIGYWDLGNPYVNFCCLSQSICLEKLRT
uniref:Uncharacterized protein n=1 Tax=Rhizophora mucronata TaxID=61149 RepID=A0A2P2PIH7_RHIMU